MSLLGCVLKVPLLIMSLDQCYGIWGTLGGLGQGSDMIRIIAGAAPSGLLAWSKVRGRAVMSTLTEV